LVNQEDEAAPDLDVVTAVSLYHAFLGLAKGPAQDTTRWQAEAEEQAKLASRLKWRDQPTRESEETIAYLGDTLDSYSWP